MNANAEKWLKALRSGDYVQRRGSLAGEDLNGEISHCCLGVACEVYRAEGGRLSRRGLLDFDFRIGYGPTQETGVLPDKVRKWLGLADECGSFMDSKGHGRSLAALNDGGMSFKMIARTVERNEKRLFLETKEK